MYLEMIAFQFLLLNFMFFSPKWIRLVFFYEEISQSSLKVFIIKYLPSCSSSQPHHVFVYHSKWSVIHYSLLFRNKHPAEDLTLAEADRSLSVSSRLVWSTWWVPRQSRLYRESLSQNTKPKQNKISLPYVHIKYK